MSFESDGSYTGIFTCVITSLFILGQKDDEHPAASLPSGRRAHRLLGSGFLSHRAEEARRSLAVIGRVCFSSVVSFPQPQATAPQCAAHVLFTRSCWVNILYFSKGPVPWFTCTKHNDYCSQGTLTLTLKS